MSYSSSVPDAKTGLVTLLEARAGLANVAIRREYPLDPSNVAGASGVQDAVFIGRDGGQVVTGTALVPVFRSTPIVFDETYTLWLTCQSLKDTSDGTQAASTARAYELAGEVVGAVATNPRLGLTDSSTRSMFHVGLDGAYQFEEFGGFLASGGYGCQVRLGLACTARITIS